MAEYIEVDRNKLCLFAHKIHFTVGPNTHTHTLALTSAETPAKTTIPANTYAITVQISPDLSKYL